MLYIGKLIVTMSGLMITLQAERMNP